MKTMLSRLPINTVLLYAIAGTMLSSEPVNAQTREEKVRADRARVESDGLWIYNDLDRAYAIAGESKKPILVVLRCIPCEECVKLDDDLVDNDPAIRPLLEQYVCVRIVGTNGLDLDTFQYDTDQSFAVFMLNADMTIYGRFGTRSHRTDWLEDVSLEGMAEALQGGLELHAQYPANRASLAGKRGKPLEFASPEKFPSLTAKFTDQLDYDGDVVKSCIHCHQIGDARRDYYWSLKQAIPEQVLFPYPHPKSIGLILDPKHRATVSEIIPGSIAASAALRAGDQILSMSGQPLLSMADVQWVLDRCPAEGTDVPLSIERDGATMDLTLKLPSGWRRLDDITWRVSSWGLARRGLGGMRLSETTAEERAALGVPVEESKMALLVRSVGKFGPHAAAKKAGVEQGDVLVEYDGRSDLLREADVFAYVNSHHQFGENVAIAVMRNGKRLTLNIPIQE